uniref:Nucleotid_trans domain-containing protein n=1 Tax=Rhabditophanes sp. KR3021 TaxID=114890 RepID=A0AC35TV19_9BILA
MKTKFKYTLALVLSIFITYLFLSSIIKVYKLDSTDTFVIHPSSTSHLNLNNSKTKDIKIHIISVVDKQDLSNYDTALNTVQCYAMQRGYTYHLLNIKDYSSILAKCPYNDFMFQRHCFLSYYLSLVYEDDYVIFIDTDLGIINPNKKFEDYLPRGNEQFLFVQRMFNYEIMAGTFIFKNTNYSRNFLLSWALYDYKKPDSFNGSDNVALHAVLMDLMPLNKQIKRPFCQAIWESSKNFGDCSKFVACMRYLFSDKDVNGSIFDKDLSFDDGKIVALSKHSKRRWMRDVWITDSEFSMDDFMFHSMKEVSLHWNIVRVPHHFGDWINPINMKSFDILKCNTNNYYENWSYYFSYFKSAAFIENKIKAYNKKIEEEYIIDLKTLKLI